jgi:hypothetical protein
MRRAQQWICIHTINVFTLERLLRCPFLMHGRAELDVIYIWHTCVLGHVGGEGGSAADKMRRGRLDRKEKHIKGQTMFFLNTLEMCVRDKFASYAASRTAREFDYN